MNPRTNRCIAAGAIAAGALVVAACGGDGDVVSTDDTEQEPSDVDTSPDDGIALLAAGTGETIQLPVSYEVGQRSTSTIGMNLDLAVDAEGQNVDTAIAFEMETTQEVVAASDQSTTIETTVDSVDVTDAPAEARASMESLFEGLVGKVLIAEYDDSGNLVGELTPKDGGSVPPELAQSLEQMNSQIKYPTEPVGVDAEWEGTTTVESNGIDMEVATTFRLTEITDDEYVVTVDQDAPIDESIDGLDLEGTLTGSGEARISRTNPASIDMEYAQDADFDISGDGQSGTMTMNMELSMQSR
jgi:hypothetical protein